MILIILIFLKYSLQFSKIRFTKKQNGVCFDSLFSPILVLYNHLNDSLLSQIKVTYFQILNHFFCQSVYISKLKNYQIKTIIKTDIKPSNIKISHPFIF